MKKILIIITSIFLSSCFSSSLVKQVSYTENKALYPAVYGALKKYRSVIERADINNDIYFSSYIYVKDLLVNTRFRLKIEKKENKINVEIRDMADQDANTGGWRKNDLNLSFDKGKFINNFSRKLLVILLNDNLYAKYKSQVLTDFSFNYIVMKGLTTVGKEEWFNENMKNKIYDIDLELMNLNRNRDKIIKGEYVASFSYPNILNQMFHISLYTNNRKYIPLKPNASVRTKGKVISTLIDKFSDKQYITMIEVGN